MLIPSKLSSRASRCTHKVHNNTLIHRALATPNTHTHEKKLPLNQDTQRCNGADVRTPTERNGVQSLDTGRPDMTFAVDWALNNNYLSIYPSTLAVKAKNHPMNHLRRLQRQVNETGYGVRLRRSVTDTGCDDRLRRQVAMTSYGDRLP